MIEKDKLIKLLLISLVLISCNTQETIAFRFMENDGSLTSHFEGVYNSEIRLLISNIISTDQKFQGLNSEFSLKSMNQKIIKIDTIIWEILRFGDSERSVETEIQERFTEQDKASYPITLTPKNPKSFLIKVKDQEELNFELGDSILLQIDILYSFGEEERLISLEKKKYYSKLSKYIML